MATTSTGVSEATIRATVSRAQTFLLAIGGSPSIGRTMAQHGFTDEDLEEGWRLHRAVRDASEDVPAPPEALARTMAARARIETDARRACRVAAAGLERLAPATFEAVFGDVTLDAASFGLVELEVVLQRLQTLDDAAALALLEKRGLGADVREALAAVVAEARGVIVEPAAAETREGQARLAAARALYAWYHDWSQVARSVFERRSDLLRLGLAQRKRSARGPAATEAAGRTMAPGLRHGLQKNPDFGRSG